MTNKLLYTRDEWFIKSFFKSLKITIASSSIAIILPFLMMWSFKLVSTISYELTGKSTIYDPSISLLTGIMSWLMVSFSIIMGIVHLKNNMDYYDKRVKMVTIDCIHEWDNDFKTGEYFCKKCKQRTPFLIDGKDSRLMN